MAENMSEKSQVGEGIEKGRPVDTEVFFCGSTPCKNAENEYGKGYESKGQGYRGIILKNYFSFF